LQAELDVRYGLKYSAGNLSCLLQDVSLPSLVLGSGNLGAYLVAFDTLALTEEARARRRRQKLP
jgi:hypothetical protein